MSPSAVARLNLRLEFVFLHFALPIFLTAALPSLSRFRATAGRKAVLWMVLHEGRTSREAISNFPTLRIRDRRRTKARTWTTMFISILQSIASSPEQESSWKEQ